jgi:dTDP-glucose 4,6-dehydratase
MKILVTGSNGVIGTWLRKILSERGHEVIGIDVSHGFGEIGWEQSMSSEKSFKYARCDLSNFRQLQRIFEAGGPFDYVYHTAAEFGRWNGEDYYEQVWATNVIGTKHIIRLQEHLGFRLVHFSSSEVYGDYPGKMTESVMEKEEVKQLNDYALSKWVNENQIRTSGLQHGTETVIVRPFNTYGPGERFHPYRSVNCKFAYHALHRLPIVVYRGHSRTFTYLEDACNTFANIIDNFKPGEVYNIGGNQHRSIEDLADITWELGRVDRALIEYRDGEILTKKDKLVDVTKSIKDLGHKDSVSLEEGTQRTLDWMRSQYNLV